MFLLLNTSVRQADEDKRWQWRGLSLADTNNRGIKIRRETATTKSTTTACANDEPEKAGQVRGGDGRKI